MPESASELTALLEKIETYPDPRRASAEWKQVFKFLQATDLDKRRMQHVVGMRDVAGLKDLIAQLAAPAAPAGEAPDEELCKRATRAFKKRSKLTRLDDESQRGRGPLSKGAD
ncbi:MAG: hypothetical protein KGY81_05800, partial [Phycisphaerae bacterium]|nr:hypothetical protein [Phycisphaerae bacterium]